MDDKNIQLLDATLEQLREVAAVFDEFDVGVAVIHLEACIAALESRIDKARSGGRPLQRMRRKAERTG